MYIFEHILCSDICALREERNNAVDYNKQNRDEHIR